MAAPALQAAAPVQEVKSPGGITAWLQEDESQPIVALAFAWRGGFESDPENRQGLSMLATTMLTHGAGGYDDNAFQQALEDNAISLSFNARRDSITGSLRSLKETLPLALKLLRASLTSPHFGPEALAREKEKQVNSLKFNMADPGWLLLRLAMRESFAGHPYGKRALGNEASIRAITAEDLKAWMKNLARGNLVVTATGAITPQELSKLLDDTFSGLPDKAAVSPPPEAQIKGGGKTFLIKVAGPQAQLFMTWPGLKRRDADWYTLEVLDYILGGGSFSSRLMDEIREKRGLTYGVSSSTLPLDHAALYTIDASFAGKNAAEVLRLISGEITKIQTTPVSAEELQAAKDYLIGSYPLSLTSSSSVASHFLSLRLDGLPMDEEDKHAAAIRAVTPEQVQALAKKMFAAPPAVFLVGQPEGVKPDASFEKID